MQQCLYIIKSATVGDTTICLLLSILVVNKIGLAANFSYQRSVIDTAHRARILRRFFYRKIKEGKNRGEEDRENCVSEDSNSAR